METSTANTKSTSTAWERPIEWFVNRVGSVIYRAPFFSFEQNMKEPPKQQIKSQEHAGMLFDLQRPGRPLWYDRPDEVNG